MNQRWSWGVPVVGGYWRGRSILCRRCGSRRGGWWWSAARTSWFGTVFHDNHRGNVFFVDSLACFDCPLHLVQCFQPSVEPLEKVSLFLSWLSFLFRIYVSNKYIYIFLGGYEFVINDIKKKKLWKIYHAKKWNTDYEKHCLVFNSILDN